jgi:YD repeat-containing protein
MSRSKLLGFVGLFVLGIVPALAQSNPLVQYFYDDLGRLSRVVDQNGNSAAYNYDAVGNLLSIARTTVPANNGLAILNFNPQQGPVGTSFTIQGQGFNPTPSADAVQFNGVSAAVIAATATSLTLTAPTGATTSPNSVTVAGTTASSDTNFTVIPVTLVSLVVRAVSLNIVGGSTQQFTATGTDKNGTMSARDRTALTERHITPSAGRRVPFSHLTRSLSLSTGWKVQICLRTNRR